MSLFYCTTIIFVFGPVVNERIHFPETKQHVAENSSNAWRWYADEFGALDLHKR